MKILKKAAADSSRLASLSDLRSTGKSRISLNFVKKNILFLILDFLVTENILLMDKNICRLCSMVDTTFYVPHAL